MHPMTVSNLQSAFAGESQAHMRYMIWADKAVKDGFPNVGRLFQAIAWAEQIHATSHFIVLRNEAGDAQTVAGAGFGLGSTSQNLAGAIAGEKFEVAEMYPAYKTVAEAQGEKSAWRSMDSAWQVEQVHAALYEAAKSAVDQGADYAISGVYVCPVCGHTAVDEAPDKCPVCGTAKEKYRAF